KAWSRSAPRLRLSCRSRMKTPSVSWQLALCDRLKAWCALFARKFAKRADGRRNAHDKLAAAAGPVARHFDAPLVHADQLAHERQPDAQAAVSAIQTTV